MAGARQRLPARTRLVPPGWGPERRHPDHQRVKHESEPEIEDPPADQGDDVLAPAADRNGRASGVGAALERNSVEHGPAENRPEQDDRAEVPIRHEVGESPDLHPRSEEHTSE